MATADIICEQLAELNDNIQSNMSIPGMSEHQLQSCIKAMVTSITVQIRTITHLQIPDATKINTSIAQLVGISDKDKGELAAAVSRQQISAMSGFGNTGHAMLQTLNTPTGIFTQSDWDFFLDKKNTEDMIIHRACDRLQGLGLVHPHETPTCKGISALLTAAAFHHIGSPTTPDTLRVVGKLKLCLTKARKLLTPGIVFPTLYPDDMTRLDPAVYSNAYSAEDPPIPAPITTYMQVLRFTKVRKDKCSVASSAGMNTMLTSMLAALSNANASYETGHNNNTLRGLVMMPQNNNHAGHNPMQDMSVHMQAGQHGHHSMVPLSWTTPPAKFGQGMPMSFPGSPQMHGFQRMSSSASCSASDSPPIGDVAPPVPTSHCHAPTTLHTGAGAAAPATVHVPPPKHTVAEMEAIALGTVVPGRRITRKRPADHVAMPAAAKAVAKTIMKATAAPKHAAKGKGKGKGKGTGKGKTSPSTITAVRPPMPSDASYTGSRIKHLTGGILISTSSKCYRVFHKGGDRVDHKVFWHKFTKKADAWAEACAQIEHAHA